MTDSRHLIGKQAIYNDKKYIIVSVNQSGKKCVLKAENEQFNAIEIDKTKIIENPLSSD